MKNVFIIGSKGIPAKYGGLTNKEKAKIRDNKFKKRIVQNPQIGFWEKVLDRIKG